MGERSKSRVRQSTASRQTVIVKETRREQRVEFLVGEVRCPSSVTSTSYVFSKIVRRTRTGSSQTDWRSTVNVSYHSDQSQRSPGHIAKSSGRCGLADNRFHQCHSVSLDDLLTIRKHLKDFTWPLKHLMFLKDDFNFKKSVTLVNHITHLDHTKMTLHKGLT